MTTIHASAVLVGARAVLVRGPAGAGKSRLAFALIDAAAAGLLPFARLVGDDRVLIDAQHGRLLVRPAPRLAGLIEVCGLGIRVLPHEEVAAVGLVVDLAADDAERLPATAARNVTLAGITLPRLSAAPGLNPFALVIAALRTPESTEN